MIKSIRTVDVVDYENESLKIFYDKKEEHGQFDSIIQEIQTDFSWLTDGYARYTKDGIIEIIALDIPLDQMIEEINEIIEAYDLEDY